MTHTSSPVVNESDSTSESEELERREEALLVAALLIIALYALTSSFVFAAIAAALGLLYVIPVKHIRKMLGYLTFVDVAFTIWLVGVAAATQGGFIIAVMAGLAYSVVSRELLASWGYQRLSINGDTSIRALVAGGLTQSVRWIKAVWRSLWSDGPVVAPEPLDIKWISVDGGGFEATRIGRLWARIREACIAPVRALMEFAKRTGQRVESLVV